MGTFRKAALAGATAVAIAFGSTAVATAQDAEGPATGTAGTADTSSPYNESVTGNDPENPSLSARIGRDLDSQETVTALDIFGGSSHKPEHEAAPFDELPGWAQALYVTGIVGAIASFIGLIVAPIANFIQFGPK